MTLEELLADRDVLHRDEPASRFVLRDGIDEIRRVSIVDAAEEGGNV